MKIIAGSLRSRRILTVEGEGYRPAMSRVRESLFSMLTARMPGWPGSRVLDLFAGSGSLAFEALSRGAETAWMVEMSPKALRCLQRNIEDLDLAGKAFLVGADVLKVLRHVKGAGRDLTGPFDVIFLDPPYRKRLAQSALDAVVECGWVAEGGFVVLEIEEGLTLTIPEGLSVDTDKLFGQTRILILHADETDG